MHFYSLFECPELFNSAGWCCVSCSQENSGYIEGIVWRGNHCEGVMATQMPGSNIPDILCGGISLRNCMNQKIQEAYKSKCHWQDEWNLYPPSWHTWRDWCIYSEHLILPECFVNTQLYYVLSKVSDTVFFIHSFGNRRIRRFLAVLSSFLQLSLSLMTSFQSLSSLLASLYTSSFHLILGRPLGLLLYGPSQISIFFGNLLSAIRNTCPSHLSLLILITSTMLGSLPFWSSSSLLSILHSFNFLSNTGLY